MPYDPKTDVNSPSNGYGESHWLTLGGHTAKHDGEALRELAPAVIVGTLAWPIVVPLAGLYLTFKLLGG